MENLRLVRLTAEDIQTIKDGLRGALLCPCHVESVLKAIDEGTELNGRGVWIMNPPTEPDFKYDDDVWDDWVDL